MRTIHMALLLSIVAIPCVAQEKPTVSTPVATPTVAPEDQNPDKLFEGYPREKEPYNDALGAIITSHLNAKSNLQGKQLLYATWFYGGRPKVSMQNMLSENGNLKSYRDVFNWAIQASGNKQIEASKMSLIKEQLKEVPNSDSHPPLTKLLIFSFQRDGKWHTRTFDKFKSPASVTRVFQLLGRPLPLSK